MDDICKQPNKRKRESLGTEQNIMKIQHKGKQLAGKMYVDLDFIAKTI
jgi:hypothetical protein